VFAAAVAASIPAAAAKIPHDDSSDDFDSPQHSPGGSAGSSSSGAWLLADEEAGQIAAKCRSHHGHKQIQHRAGSYQPPPLREGEDDLVPEKDVDEREAVRFVVVVESPASDDVESEGSSDQLQGRDQTSRD
jgi:hypothetical protein